MAKYFTKWLTRIGQDYPNDTVTASGGASPSSRFAPMNPGLAILRSTNSYGQLRFGPGGTPVTAINCEMVCQFRQFALGEVTANAGWGFGFRLDAASNEGVYLGMRGGTGTAGYRYKLISGAFGNDAMSGTAGPAQADGTRYRARFRANGSALSMHWWLATDPEPGTYATITDSARATTAGQFGIMSFQPGSAFRVDWAGYGTDGDTAPLIEEAAYTVIGTVLDPDGVEAEGYLVRLYDRTTGVLIDETLSNSVGAFAFSIPYGNAARFQCVAVDQLGNAWNAPIRDLIEPAPV